jgi:signal transduction histidine kinase
LTIDADQFAQAVGNLLSNAVKYTPPGGAISIDAGIETDAVWIRVRAYPKTCQVSKT